MDVLWDRVWLQARLEVRRVVCVLKWGLNGCVSLYCLRQETDQDDCEGRYNTFYVLYPVGIASEMYLIYHAIEPAGHKK